MDKKLRPTSLHLLKELFKNKYSDLADVGKSVGHNSDERYIRANMKKFIKRHELLISIKDGKYFPTILCQNTYLKDKHYIQEDDKGELKELHKLEYNINLVYEPRFDFLQHLAHKHHLHCKPILKGAGLYIKDFESGYSARIYNNKRVIIHLLEHPQGTNLQGLIEYTQKEIRRCIMDFEMKLMCTVDKSKEQYFELQDTHLAFINHPIMVWLKKNKINIKIKSKDGKYNDMVFDKSDGYEHWECENKYRYVEVHDQINKLMSDVNEGYSISENFKNNEILKNRINSNELDMKEFIKNETNIIKMIVGDLSRFKTEQLERSEDITNNLGKVAFSLNNVLSRIERVENILNMR